MRNSAELYELDSGTFTLQKNNPRRFLLETINNCELKYYLAILYLSAIGISVYSLTIVNLE